MPNKTEYFTMAEQKVYFTLFIVILPLQKFVKMRIPNGSGQSFLFSFVWRQRSLRFKCVDFGWRTFFKINHFAL